MAHAERERQQSEQRARAERERQQREQRARAERERQQRERRLAERERIEGGLEYLPYLMGHVAAVSALVLWYLSKSVSSYVVYWPGGLSAQQFIVLSACSLILMSIGLFLARDQGSSGGSRSAAVIAYLGGCGASIAAGFSGALMEALLGAYIEAYGTTAHNLMALVYMPLIFMPLISIPVFLFYVWMTLSALFSEAE